MEQYLSAAATEQYILRSGLSCRVVGLLAAGANMPAARLEKIPVDWI